MKLFGYSFHDFGMNLFGYSFPNHGKHLSYKFCAIGYEITHEGWYDGYPEYLVVTFLGFFQVWFRVTTPNRQETLQ